MNIRLRRDLEFVKRGNDGDEIWVVKDPISFAHFMFSSHEFRLLQLFDGDRAEQQIQATWQSEFKTRALSIEQVRQFANRLIQDNLVTVGEYGYGGMLHDRKIAQRKQKRRALVMSPLAIRFRGINPRTFLDQIYWLGWLLFHPLVMAGLLGAVLAVFLYLFGHFEELAYRIPTISQFLSAQGVLGIAVTLSVVKVIHEIGHALACRRCGGDCFEIGVILLAFIPTLYCNVSDAWTFPERWKRVLVSFGGIYFELLLAAVAAVVWLMTGPGLLNSVMFNVVALCTINTILVNGNPLLRYDGYYLLSDLTEQPNLSRRAQEALRYFFVSLFAVPKREQEFSPWILVFGILSFVYRWFVIVSILFMIYLFMKGVGLRLMGQYVVVLLMAGMLLRPLMMRRKTPIDFSGWRRISLARSAFPVAVAALAISVFVWIPFPGFVRCNLIVEVDDPTPIYASHNGKLTYVAQCDQIVESGEIVARIESLDIDQSRREIKNRIDRAKNTILQLQRQINVDPAVALSIAVLNQNVEADQAELAVVKATQAKLVVRSPVAGVVLPARIRNAPFGSDKLETTPTQWLGHPTDQQNKGCFVERGQHLFSIGQADQKTVTLFVGEHEINRVQPDQSVRLLFAQHPQALFDGRIEEIYEVDVDLNAENRTDIGVETYQDITGRLKSTETPYRITVATDRIPKHVFPGSGGRARISTSHQTLAQKMMKFLKRLASFNL